MQTVEQIQLTVADDGYTEPTERGSAGDISQNGSDAESQNAAKREWEELISSERYSALYRAHVSEIVKKRLKSEKQSSELLDGAVKLLGLEAPEQLHGKIAELIELAQQPQAAQRDWESEQGAVREKYPEFDLQQAGADPAFAALLQSFAGVPEISLTRVYELYELEHLKAAAAQSAAARTAREMMGAVRMRHARPYENGLRDAASEEGRASRLTRAQRAVLAERAAKGEHITF